jgi:hypothetical protein
MSTAQNPQGENPGGLHDSGCGGTHSVLTSVLPEAPYVARLRALDDNELAAFSRALDTALHEARRGPYDSELDDLLIVAANARRMLRSRRARTAGERAKDLVRQLMTTSTEPNQ